MSSQAISGVGTVFSRFTDSDWVAIAEIKNVSGPDISRDTMEVTSINSTNNFREFIATDIDAGTVTLSMNFTRAGYDLLFADLKNTTPQEYRVLLPDSLLTSIEFEGLVINLPMSVKFDDVISLEVTIKISGEVVIKSNVQTLPIVETLVVENIVYGVISCSVDFRLNLINLGLALPFGYPSIAWGLSGGVLNQNATITNNGSLSLGIRTRNIDHDLPPDTDIYYQANAMNSAGYAYGEILMFHTPSS